MAGASILGCAFCVGSRGLVAWRCLVLAYEGVVERDEKGYLIRLPDEVVGSIRWREGDRVKIEVSEWRGRVVIVVYK